MKPVKRKIKPKTDIESEVLLQANYLDEDNGGTLKYSSSEGPGHIPPEAKRILDEWMFNHRFYCYPSKSEKQQLSMATKLSVQRISNWFVNSRRRILPKLIENDGKNVSDFIITRKRQRPSMASHEEARGEDPGNGTCLNNTDFEYTLSGDRVLKRPKMVENDNVEPQMPLEASELERCGDEKPVEQPSLESESAGSIANISTSGLIVDHTTNLKYLYILVESTGN